MHFNQKPQMCMPYYCVYFSCKKSIYMTGKSKQFSSTN